MGKMVSEFEKTWPFLLILGLFNQTQNIVFNPQSSMREGLTGYCVLPQRKHGYHRVSCNDNRGWRSVNLF
jgi:hypothetical protein